MSHLLELLGRGLDHDLADLLKRYYWAPQAADMAQLQAQCRLHPDQPESHLKVGLAHLCRAECHEAAEHLRLACRHDPDNIAPRLALACAYEQAGDVDRALDQLRIANQVRPGEVPVLFAIGFCCERAERPADAAEFYRDAVARDPAFRAARERLAAVAVLLGNLDEAIAQYQQLRHAEPQDTWVRSALAHLYFRDGQYDRSVEEFEAAIVLEPENWALADDEVESLVAAGRLREAIERLHALLDVQGPIADRQVRLADLYASTGDDDAAMAHYRSALDAQPAYLEATVKMGTHHLAMGRWEEAGEAFHDAAEINDRGMLAYVGKGVAEAAAGRQAAAMESFELAAAIEPNSTLLLTEMARLQLKAHVADAFAKSFEVGEAAPLADIELDNDHLLFLQVERHAEEVERCPHHADLRYRYGVLLRAEGRLVEAAEQFQQAIEINPCYVQAVVKLGITQQQLGRVDEAIETFHRALDIKPQFVDLHYRLGLLYTDRRQFEEAVRHMEAAVAGAPDNRQIRAGLALALQNMGLMDRAAATWRSLCRIHHANA